MTSRPSDRPNVTAKVPVAPTAVLRPHPHWYVLATSEELGALPLARSLFGVPIVLFRDPPPRGVRGHAGPTKGADLGKAYALLDRCAHRNVPLSNGRVLPQAAGAAASDSGRLACAYHGWQFDGTGACRKIPSFTGCAESPSRRVPAFATVEQDGLVWVFGAADQTPAFAPFRMPYLDDARYTIVRQTTRARAGIYATAENALDVPHTAFLHRGLFRSESRNITLQARIVRTADRVTAEYIGEPRPPGIVATLLSPSGGVVTHFDRFILPSIAQVEYRIGEENHILVTSALTPVSANDDDTILYNVVALRTRVPARAIAPFVKPLAVHIFRQDARILARQTETIRTFGGEHFASTEIDVLGRHIALLLKGMTRGDSAISDERHEETAELVV